MVECWAGVEWVDGGGDCCGFGHCRNGSRRRGRNPVHLKDFDVHFQVRVQHGSDRLVELLNGLEDQEHLDGNHQGSLYRRGCM